MAQVINADDGSISGSAGLKSSSDGTAVLTLQTKGSDALTVDASQNVGIGTTSPGAKLSVDGSAIFNDSGADVDFRVEGNGDSHLLFADANENAVGISTGGNALDDFKFEVVGNKAIGGVRISDTFDANGYEIVTGTTNIITSYNRGTATWLPLRQRANQHEFYCDGVETARLDSAGNLGLGVTPSAWGSSYKAFQLPAGSIASYPGQMTIGQNFYDDGAGTYKYYATAAATRYMQSGGLHYWYTAASDTAGNPISFTQAMTLDASGNLGVGTTSPTRRLSLDGGAGTQTWTGYQQAGSEKFVVGLDASGNPTLNATTSTPMVFATNDIERARITADGVWFFNGVANTKSSYKSLTQSTANNYVSVAYSAAQVSVYLRVRYQLWKNNSGVVEHQAGDLVYVWRSDNAVPTTAATNTYAGSNISTFTFTQDTANNKITLAINPGAADSGAQFTYSLEVMAKDPTVIPTITHL